MLPQKASKKGAPGTLFIFRMTHHATCKDQDAWIRVRTSVSLADRKTQGQSYDVGMWSSTLLDNECTPGPVLACVTYWS